MKLFVDDLREFPKQGYECVRTYEDAIMLLRLFANKIELVNLDFDLGGYNTGLDILEYMNIVGIVPKTIIVHSTHPEGVRIMKNYIESNFKNSEYLHRPL